MNVLFHRGWLIAGIFHSLAGRLIDTAALARWGGLPGVASRFNGFDESRQTVETVGLDAYSARHRAKAAVSIRELLVSGVSRLVLLLLLLLAGGRSIAADIGTPAPLLNDPVAGQALAEDLRNARPTTNAELRGVL